MRFVPGTGLNAAFANFFFAAPDFNCFSKKSSLSPLAAVLTIGVQRHPGFQVRCDPLLSAAHDPKDGAERVLFFSRVPFFKFKRRSRFSEGCNPFSCTSSC